MTNSDKNLTALLRAKKDKLDWVRFNFLENLLVFCALRELSVPKESGVHFRVALGSKSQSLCLLFKIDRETDALVPDQMARPDYLVAYVKPEVCILTIIEMKGAGGLRHGVTQLKAFRDILKKQISAHLPSRFRSRVYIQGILLAPFNSQIPNKLIAREAASGFNIVPLLYHHKAELFPYVSKKLNLTDKYKHQILKDIRSHTLLEQTMIKHALPDRIKDSMIEVRSATQGIYVNYLLSENGEYGVLASATKTFLVGVNESGTEFKKRFESELANLGLNEPHDYSFQKIAT